MGSDQHKAGVYYLRSDYIGTGRRLLIDVVDIIVASTLSLVTSAGSVLLLSTPDAIALGALITWSAVWFGYFVLLKRSRFRTLGYALTGARIVNLQGKSPSIGSLTLRLLFAIFGPLNLLFDLFWIPSDPARQALRDKFAHTYVVRRRALPAGSGGIRYTPYTILGGSFIFQEVKAGDTGAP
jgi:uncharacterized RDD family membrane protein YckC